MTGQSPDDVVDTGCGAGAADVDDALFEEDPLLDASDEGEADARESVR